MAGCVDWCSDQSMGVKVSGWMYAKMDKWVHGYMCMNESTKGIPG